MNFLKSVLVMIVLGSLLTFSTLAYSRQNNQGCDKPNNPYAGATYCQAYGPSELYGWPKPLSRLLESEKNDNELVENRNISNRDAFIFNLIAFNVATMAIFLIAKYIKKHREAHTGN